MRLFTVVVVSAAALLTPTLATAQDATVVRLIREVCYPMLGRDDAAPIARSLGMTVQAGSNNRVFRSANGNYELEVADLDDGYMCSITSHRASLSNLRASIAAVAAGNSQFRVEEWRVSETPPTIRYSFG